MNNLLGEERFDFVSQNNKNFILAFNNQMTQLGYTFGDKIGSGYCWGRYMIIYTKLGVKSKKVFARIYMRDESLVLRLFLSDIDRHRGYIEKAPAHIKDVFVGTYGDCQHCHNEKGGNCQFRKIYTIDDRFIEKCNGSTFEFHEPGIEKIPDYTALFNEFYGKKRAG